ncbi:Tetratricopeptide repeat (TPR)-like superfamily protein [Hibiscus syriacus]|uniref:Tetratricopeptide repeat (TPR)-like superfamily protein n=1 Tax=Hibiscus syriacus TaxID=106335 RepID=A0A6A3CQC5_HIBSY|nr:UPF0481 protein At3g47200-like [Hibiscus syriacus]KAE8731735.1 Tetratricopeptide repeat (TPR)-like superfamily protein [Hibiscus syriacus]
MRRNQEPHQREVRLLILEMEQPDFITQEVERMESALREVENWGNASSPRARPLIQRVSSVLRGIKPDFQKYFEPRLVSIGPLHHGKSRFKRSEQAKHKLAALFVQENGITARSLFDKIKVEINELRECYNPDDIKEFDDDRLAWMFFIDGSATLFTIHNIVKRTFENLKTKVDRLVFAQVDVFLLENQLPYRVLQILIESSKEPQQWKNSITKFIAESLMTNVESGRQSQHGGIREDGEDDYAHLLERLREEHLTGSIEENSKTAFGRMFLSWGDNQKHRKTYRSFKELKESGIKVQPSESNNLKNISFHCNLLGRLKMPRLLVDDSIAFKFMNLVALETCLDYENDFAITSYLCFLDSLINTAEDVKELRVKGLIHNYLGSDQEVADLFNKMSRDLVPDQGIYIKVTESIHKYCNNPLTPTVAQLIYTHFSSPWTVFGFFGAIFYLSLSIIQAYFSSQGGSRH